MTRTPWLALTAWRERDGHSIASLAEAATTRAKATGRKGISRPFLSQLESGLREPTPTVTRLLAETLNVPISSLWKPAPAEDDAHASVDAG